MTFITDIPFFTTWNLILVFIVGAEIIHLFEVKFFPDLLTMDLEPDKLEGKYTISDIYPFLFIEIFYLIGVFYLLFSPLFLLWVYAIVLLLSGVVKLALFKKIENRGRYIQWDAWITIVLTLIALVLVNLDHA